MDSTENLPVVTLCVEGMDCNNCALSITKMLERKGLQEVYVNFATKEVRYADTGVSLEEIKTDIHKLGYTVTDENTKIPFWSTERLLIFSLFFTIPLMIPHILMLFGIHYAFFHRYEWQLILSLPIVAIGVLKFGTSAFKSIRGGIPNMDVLIFLGSSAAFIYSCLGIYLQNDNYYFFETTATIITLVLAGNLMEKLAVKETTTDLKNLVSIQPDTATAVAIYGDKEFRANVPVSSLALGELFVVNSGERAATDGTIVKGSAEIDESLVTGETLPILKNIDDKVIGGSLITNGSIYIKVSHVLQNSTLSKTIELVQKAQTEKPPLQKLSDKIAGVFVWMVVGAAVFTFLINYFLVSQPFQESLLRAIAVLVISCPCAMGLAIPTAVMVGVGRMARNGILIKGARTLEHISNVRTFIFDKTGTLTEGNFKVEKFDFFESTELEKSVMAALAQRSVHALSKAVLNHLKEQKIDAATIPNDWTVNEIPGKGIEATLPDGSVYRMGRFNSDISKNYNVVFSIETPENKEKIIAAALLDDSPRKGVKELIDSLGKQHIKTILLSGDKSERVNSFASGFNFSEIHGEKSPVEKLEVIKTESEKQPTAMVGDGINDAPALAAATLGISLGTATATAAQASQIILPQGDVSKLSEALLIGKLTQRTMYENLFWAFAYNVVAIPVAASGLLNPMWGALFMALSDVVVIGNSLRLKKRK